MAIANLFASTSESFAVVSSKDGALAEDFSAEEYSDYLATLDESKLRRRNDEPFTYFHLKLATKLEDQLKGKDKIAQLGLKQNGDVPYFTVITRLVESALFDITTDGVSVFKAGRDNKPDESLMLGLVRSMIVMDLFAALQAREAGPMSQASVDLTKKK